MNSKILKLEENKNKLSKQFSDLNELNSNNLKLLEKEKYNNLKLQENEKQQNNKLNDFEKNYSDLKLKLEKSLNEKIIYEKEQNSKFEKLNKELNKQQIKYNKLKEKLEKSETKHENHSNQSKEENIEILIFNYKINFIGNFNIFIVEFNSLITNFINSKV